MVHTCFRFIYIILSFLFNVFGQTAKEVQMRKLMFYVVIAVVSLAIGACGKNPAKSVVEVEDINLSFADQMFAGLTGNVRMVIDLGTPSQVAAKQVGEPVEISYPEIYIWFQKDVVRNGRKERDHIESLWLDVVKDETTGRLYAVGSVNIIETEDTEIFVGGRYVHGDIQITATETSFVFKSNKVFRVRIDFSQNIGSTVIVEVDGLGGLYAPRDTIIVNPPPGVIHVTERETMTLSEPSSPSQNIIADKAGVYLGGFVADVANGAVSVSATRYTFLNGSNSDVLDMTAITDVMLVDEDGIVLAGPYGVRMDGVNGYLSLEDRVTFPVGKYEYTLTGKVGASLIGKKLIAVTRVDNWGTATGVSSEVNILVTPTYVGGPVITVEPSS